MENRVLYGLVVMLLYLVGNGFSQVEVKSMSEEEAKWEQLLIKAQQPILLTLTSSLCGVRCTYLLSQVAEQAKLYGTDITFYTADILEKPFFMRLYKVLDVPVLIVFKDGKEIKRLETNFYWGAVYDLIFKPNIFIDASAPAPSESDPSSTLFEIIVDVESWTNTLIETEQPIVVTVTSSLCGVPCAIVEDQVAQLAKTYPNRFKLYKANILENPFFASLYKVLNVPTVIVFINGDEIVRYNLLSQWATIYELLSLSVIFDSAPPPFDSTSPLPSQSGE